MSLKISSPRSSGYHNIQSLFQTISLADELQVLRTPIVGDFQLSCDHPALQDTQGNLLYRIFSDLADRLPFGVTVSLKKKIPLGAGLGGGSSNAAGFLRFLAAQMGWKLDALWLQSLLPTWGADIPFFLRGGTARVEGVGDIIWPIPALNWQSYLLIYPNFEISSAMAYRLYDESLAGRSVVLEEFSSEVIASGLGDNDFKPVVFAAYPRLQEIEAVVQSVGLPQVYLSGSGATVFVPFLECSEAESWKSRLGMLLGGCRLVVAYPVPYGVLDEA